MTAAASPQTRECPAVARAGHCIMRQNDGSLPGPLIAQICAAGKQSGVASARFQAFYTANPPAGTGGLLKFHKRRRGVADICVRLPGHRMPDLEPRGKRCVQMSQSPEYSIPAIPTRYRGRLYRSRLEARWAAVQWLGREAQP
jgi:hypothetical protein